MIKVFVLFAISLLISSCSLFFPYDFEAFWDECEAYSDSLRNKKLNIKKSLDKNERNYIILYTSYVSNIPSSRLEDKMYIFKQDSTGEYAVTKYDVYGVFTGRPRVKIDIRIKELVSCIDMNTFNSGLYSDLSFKYHIDMKVDSEYYEFSIYEAYRTKNECVFDFLDFLKSELFDLHSIDSWKD